MTDWNFNMDEAPKDERLMLAIRWFDHRVVMIGRWTNDQYARHPKPFWTYERGWGKTIARASQPFAWMLLPRLPDEADGQ